MNASSTHDTKRSEDVRARINVLSEIPQEWVRCLRRWARLNPSETAPDRNEQCLIYQSMLGAWPIPPDRLKQYVTKALREGKTHTSWIDINEDYEQKVHAFIDSLYSTKSFMRAFGRLQEKLAYFGTLSSLSQLVLKMTSPGVPDFYQGTEMLDLSLADPDNRRPVDFEARRTALESAKGTMQISDLLGHWENGELKMWMISKVLQFRRAHAELFREGKYIPLGVIGERAEHVIAFARRLRSEWCLVAVPRLAASLTKVGIPPIGEKVWRDTKIELPEGYRSGKSVFTNDHFSTGLASDLFSQFPFAVIEGEFPLLS
jgi:(1->4)-alpha-D-glucan 1-alpha-D-glucosylmutase